MLLTPALTAALFVLAHPVHETVAEVEWNTQDNCLEISMRLSVLDQQWIRRKLKAKPSDKGWPLAYLQKRFRLDPEVKKLDGKEPAYQYKWIGESEEGSHVWWYFEIHPKDGKMPAELENRVLMDRERNYNNRVLILSDQKPKRAVDLNIKNPVLKF